MSRIVETMIFALPPRLPVVSFARSGKNIAPKNRNEGPKGFRGFVGRIIEQDSGAIPLPNVIRNGLGVLREGLEMQLPQYGTGFSNTFTH